MRSLRIRRLQALGCSFSLLRRRLDVSLSRAGGCDRCIPLIGAFLQRHCLDIPRTIVRWPPESRCCRGSRRYGEDQTCDLDAQIFHYKSMVFYTPHLCLSRSCNNRLYLRHDVRSDPSAQLTEWDLPPYLCAPVWISLYSACELRGTRELVKWGDHRNMHD